MGERAFIDKNTNQNVRELIPARLRTSQHRPRPNVEKADRPNENRRLKV
jgi:hypothetical protein